MSELSINALGLPCPQPVVNTRKALLAGKAERVVVLVDDPAQAENVADLARNMGWQAQVVSREPGRIELSLTRGDEAGAAAPEEASTADAACGLPSKVVILVSSDKLGEGDPELGSLLMRGFIKTLKELAPLPHTLIFINSGVKLSCDGSEHVDELELLDAAGVSVMSCGTCLDFYNLKDNLAIGKVSNMFEIASLLVGADRVVRP